MRHMEQKMLLTVLIYIYPTVISAKQYEDPIHAFTVGVLSWLLLFGLVFIVRWIVKKSKKMTKKEIDRKEIFSREKLSTIDDKKEYNNIENKQIADNNSVNCKTVIDDIQESKAELKRTNSDNVSFPQIDINNITWNDIYNLIIIHQKEELIRKCNPNNFMIPYNHDKVNMANKIIIELGETNDYADIVRIRDMAAKIGVVVSSEQIFNYLMSICNPINYVGRMPEFNIANDLYKDVLDAENSIDRLDVLLEKSREKIRLIKTAIPQDLDKVEPNQRGDKKNDYISHSLDNKKINGNQNLWDSFFVFIFLLITAFFIIIFS